MWWQNQQRFDYSKDYLISKHKACLAETVGEMLLFNHQKKYNE